MSETPAHSTVPGGFATFTEGFRWHFEHGTRAGVVTGGKWEVSEIWKYVSFLTSREGHISLKVATVKRWLDGARPNPRAIQHILDLFFGGDPNRADRQELARLWRNARRPRPGATIPKEPIPSQGAGPRFGLNADGRIVEAPPPAFDPKGNDLDRIRQILPMVREAADDFAARLGGNRTDAHAALVRDIARYRSAVAADETRIAWGVVWGLGVRIEEAAAAAERRIADRLEPEMEDTAQSALESLRSLHAALILASAEGRKLQEQADRLRMTREEQASLRAAAVPLAASLLQHQELAEPAPAKAIAEAAGAIGEGRHPDRNTAFGIATFRNVSSLLASAAVAAAPALLLPHGAGTIGTMAAWEAIKKSPQFAAAAAALGADFHHAIGAGGSTGVAAIKRLAPFRAFVRANAVHLRGIAATTRSLRWIGHYVGFIERTDADAEARGVDPNQVLGDPTISIEAGAVVVTGYAPTASPGVEPLTGGFVLGGEAHERVNQPPADFDIGEAIRLILAGEAPPAAWRPFIVRLDLRGDEIWNLTPLAGLSALQSLDLSRTRVSDVAPLASLAALTSLDLYDTQVSDVTPLARLTALTSLNLMATEIGNLAPLARLTALTSLDLSGTRVSDVAPLANLAALTKLDLEGTRVSNVAPLARLAALTSLNLWDTRVSDVAPLASLTALTSLYLAGTQVSDVAPLASLTRLERLDLRGTKVTDFAPLAHLAPGVVRRDEPTPERPRRLSRQT